MNMELQAASRYTKIFCSTVEEQVENMKQALRSYERVRTFVNQYKAHKKAGSDAEVLSPDGVTQVRIADEMIELLPVKISKLYATITR